MSFAKVAPSPSHQGLEGFLGPELKGLKLQPEGPPSLHLLGPLPESEVFWGGLGAALAEGPSF